LQKIISLIAVVLLLLLPVQAATYEDDTVIGQAGTRYTGVIDPDSSSAETGLGNAVADAVRTAAGTELAVIPGGLIQNNLIGGDVTYGRLKLLFAEDEPLAVAEMTPAELWNLLEQSVSHVVVDSAQSIDYEASTFVGYPQISGFTMRYDVSAPVGERMDWIKLSSDVSLDPTDETTLLRVASVRGLFDGSYELPTHEFEELDMTVLDAMVDYTASGALTGEETGRVKVAGTSDNTLLGGFPITLAAITLIFLILAFRVFYHPKPSFANGFQMPPKSERYDDMALPPEAEEPKEERK
jgi:hypothetical protein